MRRRDFLKRSAAAAGAIAFPALVPSGSVLGANEKVRLGFIGVGGRANSLLRGFSEMPDVDAAVISDIDSNRLRKAVDQVAERQQGKKPTALGDFRRIIDDRTIDAVVNGTPDHWHAIPVIMACQAGKDAYVEKPCSHNIHEGDVMVKAARRYGRVVQVGIQSRSSPHHAEAYDYIRSGKLGKVCFVKAWESTHQRNLGRPADEPVPQGVDYDTWLGPAAPRPFNPLRFHGNWRWFFDFGTGDLGNDGVHRLDYAIRGLNAAREAQGEEPVTYPSAAAASGGKHFFDDAQEWPDNLYVTYDYPGATMVYEMRIWVNYPLEGFGEGAAVYGENGYVVIANGTWRAFGPGGEPTVVGSSSTNKIQDPAHKRNFLDCVRSRERPVCDIEIGNQATVACHLGNIAWRLNQKVHFDLEMHQFGTDEAANRYLTRDYRAKWSLPNVS